MPNVWRMLWSFHLKDNQQQLLINYSLYLVLIDKHIAGTKNEKLNPISIPMHGSWIFQGVLVSIDILLSSIIFISCLLINKNYLKEGHGDRI
jgi:hypothetical protein